MQRVKTNLDVNLVVEVVYEAALHCVPVLHLVPIEDELDLLTVVEKSCHFLLVSYFKTIC